MYLNDLVEVPDDVDLDFHALETFTLHLGSGLDGIAYDDLDDGQQSPSADERVGAQR